MSDKFRDWAVLYTNEHEKGNPQLLLAPREEKSLLQQVLEDEPVDDFPLTAVRFSRTRKLAKFLNDNPSLPRSVAIQRFALEHGHRVSTVRRYARLIDQVSKDGSRRLL